MPHVNRCPLSQMDRMEAVDEVIASIEKAHEDTVTETDPKTEPMPEGPPSIKEQKQTKKKADLIPVS